jgi:hypothetical protein
MTFRVVIAGPPLPDEGPLTCLAGCLSAEKRLALAAA